MINLVHFNHPYRNPLPPIGNQRCIQPCIGCQSMKLPLATFTDLMFLLYFIIHFFLIMTGSYTSQGLIQSTLYVRWPKKVRKLLKNIKISLRTSNLPKDGEARKERICEKLFHTKTKTKLQMSLYSAALMTMKKFVKVFQQEEPAVYRIYTEQLNALWSF